MLTQRWCGHEDRALPRDPVHAAKRRWVRSWETCSSRCAVARDNGFESLWAAQHFITAPVQMFQTVPLLARLLAEARGMQVGPNILVFPALNPVLVAEEAGDHGLAVRRPLRARTRARLPRGRVRRPGSPTSAAASGRLREGIDLVRKLWTGERITHSRQALPGQRRRLCRCARSSRPGPPIWIAAVVDKAIERAAHLGDEWLITFYPTAKTLAGQLQRYRDTRAAAGLPPAVDYPICRECYVGATMAQAIAEAQGPLQYKYAAYASWGQDDILDDADRFDQPFESFKDDRFIIGDEAYVRDELLRYRDDARSTTFHPAHAVAGTGSGPGAEEHRAHGAHHRVHRLNGWPRLVAARPAVSESLPL